MVSSLYSKAKEALLSAQINFPTDTIKAALVDVDTYGLTITAASFTNPIEITCGTHGVANGDLVGIMNVLGNTNANGLFIAKNTTATTLQLTDPETGANVIGNASYLGGGKLVRFGVDQYRSGLAGVAALSAALTGKSVTGGIFDADDFVFTAVPAGPACAAVVLYKDTGNISSDRLISFHGDLTGFPVTPNGADVNVSWDTGRLKVFAL